MAGDKLTKLSKIGFSMECFAADLLVVNKNCAKSEKVYKYFVQDCLKNFF